MTSSPWGYGDPSRSLAARPACWGTSKYDNEDRECRACGFQNTCRDQNIKLRPAAPTVAPSYWTSQPQQSNQYTTSALATRTPAYLAQMNQQQTIQPTAPSVQYQQVRPTTQQQQTTPTQPQGAFVDRYGQINDPMFAAVKAIPPVVRQQQPGETFSERMAKNVMLATGEAVLSELLLSLRQFIWAPRRDDDR